MVRPFSNVSNRRGYYHYYPKDTGIVVLNGNDIILVVHNVLLYVFQIYANFCSVATRSKFCKLLNPVTISYFRFLSSL